MSTGASQRLLDDLARWEHGELRVDDIAGRHPGGEAVALVEMHAWLTMLTSEPAIEAGPDWEDLATCLPDRVGLPGRRRGLPVRRLVAAFITGAVMVPATAAADKADAVRRANDRITHSVANFVVPDLPEPVGSTGRVGASGADEQSVAPLPGEGAPVPEPSVPSAAEPVADPAAPVAPSPAPVSPDPASVPAAPAPVSPAEGDEPADDDPTGDPPAPEAPVEVASVSPERSHGSGDDHRTEGKHRGRRDDPPAPAHASSGPGGGQVSANGHG